MSLITPRPLHESLVPHERDAPTTIHVAAGLATTAQAEQLRAHVTSIFALPIEPALPADPADAPDHTTTTFTIEFTTPDGAAPTALEPTEVAGQEYELTITADHARITSTGVGGWHYGITALRRLITPARTPATNPTPTTPNPTPTWTIHLGTVQDAPDLAWRGFSLDVARSFFPYAELTRLIDLIAAYRFNVLHLHLTDDQGWRLESLALPALSDRGGITAVAGGRAGMLSQADYTHLQEYALARGITVVPEIDIPGHTNAALNALPELNRDGQAPDVYTGIEVGFSRIRTELPATLPFLRTVFTELAGLTLGRYIHLGGDEAHQVPGEDYAQLVEAAQEVIATAGKVPLGWQEIAGARLHQDTIMQLWDRRSYPEALMEHSRAGRRSILSPANRAYLDMSARPGQGIGVNWDTEFDLADAYDWDPRAAVPGLVPDTVVGVEATMWSEFVHHFDTLTTLILPRLVAIAEVGWTPQSARSWEDFQARVEREARWWADAGLAFDEEGLA